MSARIAPRWLAHVRRDLDSALKLVRGPDPQRESAAYHAQQAAEKLIKAGLVLCGIHPPRVRELSRLVAELPESFALKQGFGALEPISSFAVTFRYPDYPDPGEPPTVDELEGWITTLEGLLRRTAEIVDRELATMPSATSEAEGG